MGVVSYMLAGVISCTASRGDKGLDDRQLASPRVRQLASPRRFRGVSGKMKRRRSFTGSPSARTAKRRRRPNHPRYYLQGNARWDAAAARVESEAEKKRLETKLSSKEAEMNQLSTQNIKLKTELSSLYGTMAQLIQADRLQQEHGLRALEDKLDEAENRLTCSICMDRPRDVVFQPCGHLAVCRDCCQKHPGSCRFRKCPICRRPVEKALTVIMA